MSTGDNLHHRTSQSFTPSTPLLTLWAHDMHSRPCGKHALVFTDIDTLQEDEPRLAMLRETAMLSKKLSRPAQDWRNGRGPASPQHRGFWAWVSRREDSWGQLGSRRTRDSAATTRVSAVRRASTRPGRSHASNGNLPTVEAAALWHLLASHAQHAQHISGP